MWDCDLDSPGRSVASCDVVPVLDCEADCEELCGAIGPPESELVLDANGERWDPVGVAECTCVAVLPSINDGVALAGIVCDCDSGRVAEDVGVLVDAGWVLLANDVGMLDAL